jgi:Family of unknown function (DUF5681)
VRRKGGRVFCWAVAWWQCPPDEFARTNIDARARQGHEKPRRASLYFACIFPVFYRDGRFRVLSIATEERKLEMKFEKGESGNPNGRPLGARNKRTIAAEKLFEDKAEDLAKVAVGLAEDGHAMALRLCLERVCAPKKSRPVQFELPALKTAADAVTAVGTVAEALAAGDLSAAEAADLAKFVQGFAHTLTTADLAQRVARLEEKVK